MSAWKTLAVVALFAWSLLLAGCALPGRMGDSPAPVSDPRLTRPAAPSVNTADLNRRLALDGHYARWRGVPYRYGGASAKGIDCSAFVQIAYAELFGRDLPRVTRDQRRVGREVTGQPRRIGDLVFFDTVGKYTHVGIYTGNGTFIHASTSRGVVRDRLDRAYWSQRYSATVRILDESI